MKWRKQQMDEGFFLSEDHMSMHGVLYKKGGNLVKKYKKRWFVLPANSLSLQFYSAPNTKLQGHIDINEILNVAPIINNKKQLHGMRITTSPNKVYELFAKSPEERDAWCNGLLSRLRLIAKTKVAARDVMVTMQEDDGSERHCQTLPKVVNSHYHGGSNGENRYSARRALSDGMLISPSLLQDATTNTSFIREIPIHSSKIFISSNEQVMPTIDVLRTPGRATPITISDDNSHFKLSLEAATRALEEGHTPRSHHFDSSDSTASIADHLASKVTKLEYLCAEKDATIAALNAMLDRQNEQKARANAGSYSPITAKNRVQQHIDEFVEIGKWLEQKKKTELEKDVSRLKEDNEQLGALLEEERQKNLFLEKEKYNMQCMIEHLEREKFTLLEKMKVRPRTGSFRKENKT